MHAVPISYEGVLVPGIASGGSVAGFSWFLEQAAGVDFWSFNAAAGSDITLRADRLDGNLDPALSLYLGITNADINAYDSNASFGGMTYTCSLDDEAPAFLQPGPGGDPLGSFRITTSGTCTVAVGGSGSTDAGNYSWRITLSMAAVPEPGSTALLAMGLLALSWLRRHR